MNEENQVYFVDSDTLPPAALERKHRLEQDPSFRTNHMEYMKGMEIIQSDIKDKVLKAMDEFDYDAYTAADVERALSHETCSVEDFKALISPAAAPYLEQMARKAEEVTKNHFGNTVYIFTPLYIANYCQNYCIYCGFNCYNNIRRKKLTFEEIEHEMQVIAKTGMEEILILTGESRAYSDVTYIGEDGYTIKTSVTESKFSYAQIRAVAEMPRYLVLALSNNQAQAFDKESLSGGTIEEFRAFLADKTGKTVQQIK